MNRDENRNRQCRGTALTRSLLRFNRCGVGVHLSFGRHCISRNQSIILRKLRLRSTTGASGTIKSHDESLTCMDTWFSILDENLYPGSGSIVSRIGEEDGTVLSGIEFGRIPSVEEENKCF